MLVVIVPIALLFLIALVRRIPLIGGDIRAALLIAGVAAALIGGVGPGEFALGVVDGVDKLAWVMALSLFGAIYAESQVRLGTMTAVLDTLRSLFGGSPKGLIAAIFITLTLAGSLLGDAIAAATVIGFLVITALAELKVKPEQIAMMIMVGASIGSIMPPIAQAVFLSASLVGTDPGSVVLIAYITVSIALVLAVLESFRFVKGRTLPPELRPSEPLGTMLGRTWPVFGPLAVLIAIVILNSGFGLNVFTAVPGLGGLVATLETVPVVKGLVHVVVLAIIVSTLVTLCYPRARRQAGSIVATGLGNVRQTLLIQLCAGFMVGMFYASGAVDQVSAAAEGLDSQAVAFGGFIGLAVLGMLTGSQTTAQTVVIPFAAPILLASAADPVNVALGASHIASGAQNLPPVGLTAFVVCGLVGATLKTKVDPVKTMLLALPNSLYFMLVGLVFWLL